MNRVIEVNQANFQQDVIERSRETPVLVDFWAPWCGPCRMLGPVLERLANEPNSQFVLAKVNSDHNPQLSMQYNVRGIPAVKAFVNGRVVDEFVGAQPEPMVRQFLQRVAANYKPQGKEQVGGNGRSQPKSPATPAAKLKQARHYLGQGQGCQAESLLANFPAGEQAAEAKKLLPLAQFLCQTGRGQQISAQGDLETIYRQAASALQRRAYSEALYNLLVALNQETPAQKRRTQAMMEGVFTLLGESNELTQQYRALV